jgi:hypothetical protein
MQLVQEILFVERSKLFDINQPTHEDEVNTNVVKLPVQVVVPYNRANPVEQSRTNDLMIEDAKNDAPNEGTEELKHCSLEDAVTVEMPEQVCVFQKVAH